MSSCGDYHEGLRRFSKKGRNQNHSSMASTGTKTTPGHTEERTNKGAVSTGLLEEASHICDGRPIDFLTCVIPAKTTSCFGLCAACSLLRLLNSHVPLNALILLRWMILLGPPYSTAT